MDTAFLKLLATPGQIEPNPIDRNPEILSINSTSYRTQGINSPSPLTLTHPQNPRKHELCPKKRAAVTERLW